MSKNKYQSQWNTIYDIHSRNNYMTLPWVNNNNLEDFKIVMDSLQLKPNATIIDIGCGTGKIANCLSDTGKIYAIDVSDKEINRCKTRYKDKDNICFDVNDVLEISTDRKYDLVVAHLLLHEIQPEDLETACRNIAQLVSENGYIFLSWLKQNDDYDQPKRPCLYAEGEYFVHYYQKEEIRKMFSGFKISDCQDVKIRTADSVLNNAKQRNVKGFTYQSLLMKKQEVSVKDLYELIQINFQEQNRKIKSGGIISEEGLKNSSKRIFEILSGKIFDLLSARGEIVDGNVFLNLQVKEESDGLHVNDGILFTFLKKFSHERADSGHYSWANILVENYHKYFSGY
ncbi:MAG: class I SAM-dependent methyltransferase [Tannerellaceae bacterium]|nr:class I SAM-dependent methyltransferase [Tannerellaceae bacterium]